MVKKKKKIRVVCECDSCNGTGLYQGMGERDGFAVVCTGCDGTGKAVHTFSYYKFTKRHRTNKVKQVLETNPGICVGRGKDNKLKNAFGGMSYKDWFNDKSFPKKSEMRKYTCPAWWYQSANYNKKPSWESCIACGSFSECKEFKNKEKCWKRWDKKNSNG